MHEKKIYLKKDPIEKALKKYPVNALEEDHVRAFSH